MLDTGAPEMMIFPEGGMSNGKGIIKFKRGGFQNEKAVRPVFLKYRWSNTSPDWTMEGIPLIILLLSTPQCITVTVNEMPVF